MVGRAVARPAADSEPCVEPHAGMHAGVVGQLAVMAH